MQSDAPFPGPGQDTTPYDQVLGDCLRTGVIAIGGHRISGINPAAQAMLGLSDGAVGGGMEVLPVVIRELLEQALVGKPHSGETVLKRKGQPLLKVQVSTLLIQSKPPGVVAILQDAAAAQELTSALQKLNRLASVGTFSAGMAHEIKNALVPVRTFLEIIMQQNKGAELASVVDRETRRIDSLVSQMLKFAGPAKPSFTAIHMHEVLEHCARLVQSQMLVKGVTLERAFQAQPDCVQGDGYQLEQVFTNVLINALEAMPFGGKIQIGTELLGGNHEQNGAVTPAVVVKIRDSGIGIAPENLSRLFDTFFTTKPTGTGLGLTITRRILKEHHASIEVQSQVNQGSTFTITLPAVAEAQI